MPADLILENGCVDDAEALDAKYTELRVDDACLGRSANTCSGCLQEFTNELVQGQKLGEGGGMEGGGIEGREGIRWQERTGWTAALQGFG